MLKYTILSLSLLAIPTTVLSSEKDQPTPSNTPQAPLTKKQIEEREEASMAKAEAAHQYRIDLYEKALRKEDGAHAKFIQEALEKSWFPSHFEKYDKGSLMGFDFGTHPAGTPLDQNPVNALTQNDLLVIYLTIDKQKLSKDLWELIFQKIKTLNPKDSNVQYLLGDSYTHGLGCDPDPEKGCTNLHLAALQGNQHAKRRLMTVYGKGAPHFPKNQTLVFGVAEMLAKESNDPHIHARLGNFYLRGFGVEKNVERALTYFRLGAEQGNNLSQFYLGEMYWQGNGVPQNMNLGLKWFEIAADQGSQDAKKVLQRLQSTVSSAQSGTKLAPSVPTTLSSSTTTSAPRPVNVTLPQNQQPFNPSYGTEYPTFYYQLTPQCHPQVWHPGNPPTPLSTNSYGTQTFPGGPFSSSSMPPQQPQNVAPGTFFVPHPLSSIDSVEGKGHSFTVDPTQVPPPSTGGKRPREDNPEEAPEAKRQRTETGEEPRNDEEESEESGKSISSNESDDDV